MMRGWWLRLRTLLWGREQLERELDEELAHHRAMAGDRLGNALYWKEETRAEWISPWLEAFAADVRQAARRLRRMPAFSAVAIATLALGSGATTAVFSMLNGLVWRPLPVAQPEQLVRLALTHLPPTERHWLDGRPVPALERISMSFAMYSALAKHTRIFDGLCAFGGSGTIHVEHRGVPSRIRFALSTGSMFRTMGLRAQAGRLYRAEDDVPGGRADSAWPAVISDGLWERMFRRSPSAIGEAIVVDRVPFTIVGVTPREFRGLTPGNETELWLPQMSSEAMFPLFKWREDRGMSPLRVFARLKPGVDIEEAARHLRGVSPGVMAESMPLQANATQREHALAIRVEPRAGGNGFSALAQSYRQPLTILLVAVGAVLLIAATNLTSLLLARSAARRHELAIRVSLGSPPSRLRREFLLESLMLAALGLSAGFLLGLAIGRVLPSLVTSDGSVRIDTSPDWRLFAMLAASLVAVTLIAGWAPARQAALVSPQLALKQMPGGGWKLRGALIAGQVALSLALTAGAALMGTTLFQLVQEETGMDRERSVFLGPDLLNAGISREAMPRVYESLLARLRTHPEIEAAGIVTITPLSGALNRLSVEVPGKPELPLAQRQLFLMNVSEGFLAAAGVKLRLGDDVPPAGLAGRRASAILSESAALRLFGSAAAAMGQSLRLGGQEPVTVTGIAADAKYFNVREGQPAVIYLPYWSELARPGFRFAIRFRAGQASAIAAFRAAVEKETGRAAFVEVRTIEANLRDMTSRERLLAWLLASMAGLALLISGTGLSGLLSYLVEQRQREFGIRVALGATAAEVRGLILRFGLLLAAGGIAAGAVLSYALRRSLDAFVFGVSTGDARIWAGAAAALLCAALLAAAGPAWRAARVDPVRMLRGE